MYAALKSALEEVSERVGAAIAWGREEAKRCTNQHTCDRILATVQVLEGLLRNVLQGTCHCEMYTMYLTLSSYHCII